MRCAGLGLVPILAMVCGGTPTAKAETTAPAEPIAAPNTPAVNTWATSQTPKPSEPMSQRLILNRGPTGSGGFLLEQGGVKLLDNRYATGLDLAVMGSDRAVGLAREAHSKLVTGAVLGWTGLGLTLGSAVSLIAVAAAYAPQNTSGSSPTGLTVGLSVSVGALLVGIVLEIVGIPYQTDGQKKECDAVNAYNSDLVDGMLRGR
jgi:hypothetical protein